MPLAPGQQLWEHAHLLCVLQQLPVACHSEHSRQVGCGLKLTTQLARPPTLNLCPSPRVLSDSVTVISHSCACVTSSRTR
jgi:hypothetical protein